MAIPNRVIAEDVRIIIADEGRNLETLAGNTLLVTGSSGFLCSYFLEVVAVLNDQGLNPPCRVLALDNMITGVPQRLAHLEGRPDFQFLCHDVTQPLQMAAKVDLIIHGASIASPTFYRQHPLETIDANVVGTRRMLELGREQGVKSFLFLSSSEIYGDPEPGWIPTPEDYWGNVSCTGPRACYDESKRLGETLCQTYFRLYGTPVKTIRPFNFFGPGQRLDDKRIIPDLMNHAVTRTPIVLYSDGLATRSFCYISDAMRAIWRVFLSDQNGEAFNVGNDMEPISISALAQRLQEVAGPPPLEIRHQVSQDADYTTHNPQRRCPDLTKLRSRFIWEPRISLTEGLSRTLKSYLETGGRDLKQQ